MLLLTVDSKNDEIRRALFFSEETIAAARRAVEDSEAQISRAEAESDRLGRELLRAQAAIADESEEQRNKFMTHSRELAAVVEAERERTNILKQMLNLRSREELELKEKLLEARNEITERTRDAETARIAETRAKEYMNERVDLAAAEIERLRGDLRAQVSETQQLRNELKAFRMRRVSERDPAGMLPQKGSLLAPWVPDDIAAACSQCEKPFSLTRRKHHCRACGRVYCYACTSRKTVVPGLGTPDQLHRVCDHCHSALNTQR